MLPHYESVYQPKRNIIDFESAREVLMAGDYGMVVKRRFQRIDNMMECKSYIKNVKVPENKEIFIYGFKNVKTDKIDNYILIGCQSDESYEKDELFNFWSNNFVNKEIEKSVIKITGCSFLTLVK